MSAMLPHPEFSRPLTVEHLKTTKRVTIDATEEECERLAQRMKVSRFDWVRAQLVISPWKGRVSGSPGAGVQVTGSLEAQVIQPCSVTLEHVSEQVYEGVKYIYIKGMNNISEQNNEKEIILEFEDDDPFEPLIGGEIDLGEMAAEVLGLAINPYPRKEGVHFETDDAGSEHGHGAEESPENAEKEPENNPFSLLARLKSRNE